MFTNLKNYLCIFSTLSSSLNSLSGVIYNDFVRKFSKKSFTEKTSVTIIKVIVVIEGIWCTSMVFVIQYLGEILPLATAITGLMDGPSLGLYTLGICFPQVDSTVIEVRTYLISN